MNPRLEVYRELIRDAKPQDGDHYLEILKFMRSEEYHRTTIRRIDRIDLQELRLFKTRVDLNTRYIVHCAFAPDQSQYVEAKRQLFILNTNIPIKMWLMTYPFHVQLGPWRP
jgi:hypothetical protein